jgi:hypothetical protein
MNPRPIPILTLLLALALTPAAFGLGQKQFVSESPTPGSFPLVASTHAARLILDPSEYPGVLRAAHDLQSDIERVTTQKPDLDTSISRPTGEIVIIGTIGHSRLIDRLIHSHKLDASAITGKWESSITQVVDHPIPGVAQALVLAGSDKRGTIFAIYDLSEQIGVSPWYWWADVPVHPHATLYVAPGRYVAAEPAVKYRGIFLNDEAPALTGWVNATYGGYNSKFYTKVFELILRLRGNYLWPAMWGSAFNEDDPDNARLADEYGIVMGTSHHEPMLRAQQEWKRHGAGPWDYATNSAVLDKFWSDGIERNKNFESTITLGMRGDGDMPMTEGANIALLEKIVADQRKILAEHATPTLNADPKVWALYKEVQTYYEKGMRVPDDITLLWCDDNWGNIRRLPTPDERKRPGGAGIYYHFDYVGDPRNYKWINTNPLPKIWEQMNLALNYGADRIWIVNVGDLKPMEFPIEYFLTLARDPARWGKDHIQEFTQLWATREFGPEHADEIASMVAEFGRYSGRRKPELLEPDTFSLTNFREADRVEADWKNLLARAEAVGRQLPANTQDAYFELVLHPIKASSIVNRLYIAAGRNHLYAREGRASANDYAQQARDLFKADAELTNQYNHVLANGKWNHMMDQTHLGYTWWQQPAINVMPAISDVQPAINGGMGVAAETTIPVEGAAPLAPPQLTFDSFTRQSHYIDVFNRGTAPIAYTATAADPWVVLSSTSGSLGKDSRIEATIDWSKAPTGTHDSTITVSQPKGPSTSIRVHLVNPADLTRDTLHGFIETDGYVSIEAEHFAKATSAGDVHWDRIPGYGSTLSGMSIFPVTAASSIDPKTSATLEYNMYLFDSGTMTLEATLGPTLNFVPGRGLRFAVWFDDQPPQIVDELEHNTDRDWSKVVSDSVRRVQVKLSVDKPGYHTLKLAMIDPGIVLEKLVVSPSKLPESYLGPPESYHQFAAK